MIKFFNILIVTLILSFAFDANAANDATSDTICRIVGYAQGLGGPMITIVIIGAALLSIFGRMPWPALFALGMFTAVFFGAPKVVTAVTGQQACKSCAADQELVNGACAAKCGSGRTRDLITGTCR